MIWCKLKQALRCITVQPLENIPSPLTGKQESLTPDMMQSKTFTPSRGSQLLRRCLWAGVYGVATIVSGGLAFALTVIGPTLGSPPAPQTDGSSQESIAKRMAQGAIPYHLSRPVNVLVMGIDRVEGAEPGSPESFSGRSDTFLLLHLDPQAQSLQMLSVPRDTQVDIPNYGLTKINHANWFGGPKLVQQVVATNFNQLPLDRYARINTDVFREIVDTIGGLEVYVPEAMDYVDQTQGLYINLPQGWQHLDGNQAEQFARFRHDAYGDIGRVQRQQVLLQSLQKKLASPAVLPKIPQLLSLMQTYVDTNLTPEELLAIVGFGLQLTPEQTQMVMLPGRASNPGEFLASYWLMDPEARDRILQDQFSQPSLLASAGIDTVSDSGQRQLRIALQNASNEPNLAQAMANHLGDLGFFDVYVIEDWPTAITTTQIIAQQGDLDAARHLQTQLQLGTLDASSTGAIESDVTLRLGQDSITLINPTSDNSRSFVSGTSLEN